MPRACFFSNTTVKSMSGFSWNFQDMMVITQETIWKILGMVGLIPWTQGSLFYFLDPCLLAASRNTGWMDIPEIFRIWTQEAIGYTVSRRLSRLSHALQTMRGGSLRSRNTSCFAFFNTLQQGFAYVWWELCLLLFTFYGKFDHIVWQWKALSSYLLFCLS